MRKILAIVVIGLALGSEAQAQYGGILPRQATGVPGLYATVPYGTSAPFPLQSGAAQGLYTTALEFDATTQILARGPGPNGMRPNAMRQPGARWQSLWRPKSKMVSPVQAFLSLHR